MFAIPYRKIISRKPRLYGKCVVRRLVNVEQLCVFTYVVSFIIFWMLGSLDGWILLLQIPLFVLLGGVFLRLNILFWIVKSRELIIYHVKLSALLVCVLILIDKVIISDESSFFYFLFAEFLTLFISLIFTHRYYLLIENNEKYYS